MGKRRKPKTSTTSATKSESPTEDNEEVKTGPESKSLFTMPATSCKQSNQAKIRL